MWVHPLRTLVWPLRHAFSLHWLACWIWSLLVKQYKYKYGYMDNLGLLYPAFQGHSTSRLLKLLWINRVVIHRNYGPNLSLFRDKQWFPLKKQNKVFLLQYLIPLLRVLPLEFCNSVLAKKNKMMTVPDSVKVWHRIVLAQYILALDL